MSTKRSKRKHSCKKVSLNSVKRTKGKDLITIFEEPCTYVNGVPAYIGTAVFLKPTNEIQGYYDNKLRNLSADGHRFVIMMSNGIKNGTVGICLLSTSSYLNENKRLDIKLGKEYSDGKDVYMDTTNCYIITTDCIKAIAYKLTEDDALKCFSAFTDNEFVSIQINKGLKNN